MIIVETLQLPQASSENLVFCWERGHHARIFQEDAGEPPAFPGVFGGCLKINNYIAGFKQCQYIHGVSESAFGKF